VFHFVGITVGRTVWASALFKLSVTFGVFFLIFYALNIPEVRPNIKYDNTGHLKVCTKLVAIKLLFFLSPPTMAIS